MADKTILLIGPMATGKSTIAGKLASLTGLRRIPMDRVRWYYYLKDGFSIEHEESIDSFEDVMAYWKPFEVKAVKRIIKEFPNSIIDFGAGHSYFSDEVQFKEVSEALAPVKNIILLLPTESKEESLKICNDRLKERVKRELDKTEIDANRDFIFEKSNYELAKHIVYTKDKTPDETASEILELLKL